MNVRFVIASVFAFGLTAPACDGRIQTQDGAPGDARDASSDARDAVGDLGEVGPQDVATDIVGDSPAATDPLDPSLAPPIDMNPASYPANVWITGPLEKVQRNGSPGAEHWAMLFAARNEFESFQVHVHAAGAPIQLNVTVGDFSNAHGSNTIAAADHVTVSRETYLHITERSDANGVLGDIPDPLVPTRDRYVNEIRNAFPTMVPAGETRSAWIDVHVPPGTPSGWYTAMVTVRDGATTLASLPVRLGVWDFEIPSTATLHSEFGMSWNGLCAEAYGSYDACTMFPGAAGSADHGTELTHILQSEFFLDRRVTIGDSVYAAPRDTNWGWFDDLYGPLMNGSAHTQLSGARLTSMRYSQGTTDTSSIQRWVDHFGSVGWLPRLFFYSCDEPPHGCAFSTAHAESTAVHSSTPPGQYLLTIDYESASANGLLDGVDIMVPVVDQMHPRGGTSQRSSYDSWLMRPGKTLWWYQSCDQHESCSNGTPGPAESTWPSYMVDASPVRNRIFQWMAYVYNVSGELYYASDFCWNGNCGGDVWTTVYAFGGNGDGTLYYPGTPSRIGGSTPIPVSSIRLELIRDGMEDYEFLHLLSAAGDDAFAQATSHMIITDASTFDNDPAHFMAARRALGDRLHRRVHP